MSGQAANPIRRVVDAFGAGAIVAVIVQEVWP